MNSSQDLFRPGPDMPVPLAYHCAVFHKNTQSVLIHGGAQDIYTPSDQTFVYDFGDGQWVVSVDGSAVASSNGVFGFWEEFDFAIGGARLSGPASRKDAKDYSKLVGTAKYKNAAINE